MLSIKRSLAGTAPERRLWLNRSLGIAAMDSRMLQTNPGLYRSSAARLAIFSQPERIKRWLQVLQRRNALHELRQPFGEALEVEKHEALVPGELCRKLPSSKLLLGPS
jgi:hypothetical protein